MAVKHNSIVSARTGYISATIFTDLQNLLENDEALETTLKQVEANAATIQACMNSCSLSCGGNCKNVCAGCSSNCGGELYWWVYYKLPQNMPQRLHWMRQ